MSNSSLYAQQNNVTTSGSITYKRVFFPPIIKYYNNGDRISKRKVKEMLKLNPNSEAYFQKYKKAKTIAVISLIPSSFMVSFVMVKAFTDALSNVLLYPPPSFHYQLTASDKIFLIGGTAGIIFSTVKMFKSDTYFKKAIKLYNNGNGKTKNMDISFGLLKNGNIGIALSTN
ncbi:MAG: hypothetical protein IPP48_07860 [Chitinophagaceae bacterium]|nr:hypothetical protein [Chitinophagaceae bacterium]